MTSKHYYFFALAFSLAISFNSVLSAQVGIGTTTPTEMLDVDGNVKFSGALMPNDIPGVINQILLSGGAGNPPVWGPELLNPAATTASGKFFSGAITINPGYTIVTITDPNCVPTSTCYISWPGPLPVGPDYGDLIITVEAQTGQWLFHIANYTGFNLTNFEFAFTADY